MGKLSRADPERLPPMEALQRKLRHATAMHERARKRYFNDARLNRSAQLHARLCRWREEQHRLEELIYKRAARDEAVRRIVSALPPQL